MATTIQIKDETWDKLIKMKTRPSETFDDIINILFEAYRVK